MRSKKNNPELKILLLLTSIIVLGFITNMYTEVSPSLGQEKVKASFVRNDRHKSLVKMIVHHKSEIQEQQIKISQNGLAILQKAKDNLFYNRQIQNYSVQELHDPREFIAQSAQALGALHQQWMEESSLRNKAFEFYKECTLNQDILTSIRVLCYLNLKEINVVLGHHRKGLQVPAELSEMVEEYETLVMNR